MSKVQLVFAVGFLQNGEYPFGNQQGLPWGHCKEDLQNFKRITTDTILLMGAQTFRSLPGKLPGRMHVVLSSDGSQIVTKKGDRADMVINGGSLSVALDVLKGSYPDKTISIIGGKRMIEESMSADLVDEIHLTFMKPHWRTDLPFDVSISKTPINEMTEKYTYVDGHHQFIDGSNTVASFIYEHWKK